MFSKSEEGTVCKLNFHKDDTFVMKTIIFPKSGKVEDKYPWNQCANSNTNGEIRSTENIKAFDCLVIVIPNYSQLICYITVYIKT
jgi:hypothetical protein